MKFYRIAHAHQREQLFHIAIAHPDAAVRSTMPNGLRVVGPVNAIAMQAEPDPSRAERIRLARRHHLMRGVPGRVLNPPRHGELAAGAGCRERANRNRIHAGYLSTLDERELAVRYVDDNTPLDFSIFGHQTAHGQQRHRYLHRRLYFLWLSHLFRSPAKPNAYRSPMRNSFGLLELNGTNE